MSTSTVKNDPRRVAAGESVELHVRNFPSGLWTELRVAAAARRGTLRAFIINLLEEAMENHRRKAADDEVHADPYRNVRQTEPGKSANKT